MSPDIPAETVWPRIDFPRLTSNWDFLGQAKSWNRMKMCLGTLL